MSSSNSRWIFSKLQLQKTPSRRDGIDEAKELSYRQHAAGVIQEMGQRLQVSQLCINTAIVYMHRFYMIQSFQRFPKDKIGPSVLFLATKVEEQPRKLEHVIRVARLVLHHHHTGSAPASTLDVKSEEYLEKAQDIVLHESAVLQTLGFEITVDHPHSHVVKTCQLVRATKDLAQTSYFLATNSLHLTTMCVQYTPTVVACVCIHVACKWSNWVIPKSSEGRDWWFYADRSVTIELLDDLTQEFLNIIASCPSRLKKKILNYRNNPKLDAKEAADSRQPPEKRVKVDLKTPPQVAASQQKGTAPPPRAAYPKQPPPNWHKPSSTVTSQQAPSLAPQKAHSPQGYSSAPGSRSSTPIAQVAHLHQNPKHHDARQHADSPLTKIHEETRPDPATHAKSAELTAPVESELPHGGAAGSPTKETKHTSYKDYRERKERERLLATVLNTSSAKPAPDTKSLSPEMPFDMSYGFDLDQDFFADSYGFDSMFNDTDPGDDFVDLEAKLARSVEKSKVEVKDVSEESVDPDRLSLGASETKQTNYSTPHGKDDRSRPRQSASEQQQKFHAAVNDMIQQQIPPQHERPDHKRPPNEKTQSKSDEKNYHNLPSDSGDKLPRSNSGEVREGPALTSDEHQHRLKSEPGEKNQPKLHALLSERPQIHAHAPSDKVPHGQGRVSDKFSAPSQCGGDKIQPRLHSDSSGNLPQYPDKTQLKSSHSEQSGNLPHQYHEKTLSRLHSDTSGKVPPQHQEKTHPKLQYDPSGKILHRPHSDTSGTVSREKTRPTMHPDDRAKIPGQYIDKTQPNLHSDKSGKLPQSHQDKLLHHKSNYDPSGKLPRHSYPLQHKSQTTSGHFGEKMHRLHPDHITDNLSGENRYPHDARKSDSHPNSSSSSSDHTRRMFDDLKHKHIPQRRDGHDGPEQLAPPRDHMDQRVGQSKILPLQKPPEKRDKLEADRSVRKDTKISPVKHKEHTASPYLKDTPSEVEITSSPLENKQEASDSPFIGKPESHMKSISPYKIKKESVSPVVIRNLSPYISKNLTSPIKSNKESAKMPFASPENAPKKRPYLTDNGHENTEPSRGISEMIDSIPPPMRVEGPANTNHREKSLSGPDNKGHVELQRKLSGAKVEANSSDDSSHAPAKRSYQDAAFSAGSSDVDVINTTPVKKACHDRLPSDTLSSPLGKPFLSDMLQPIVCLTPIRDVAEASDDPRRRQAEKNCESGARRLRSNSGNQDGSSVDLLGRTPEALNVQLDLSDLSVPGMNDKFHDSKSAASVAGTKVGEVGEVGHKPPIKMVLKASHSDTSIPRKREHHKSHKHRHDKHRGAPEGQGVAEMPALKLKLSLSGAGSAVDKYVIAGEANQERGAEHRRSKHRHHRHRESSHSSSNDAKSTSPAFSSLDTAPRPADQLRSESRHSKPDKRGSSHSRKRHSNYDGGGDKIASKVHKGEAFDPAGTARYAPHDPTDGGLVAAPMSNELQNIHHQLQQIIDVQKASVRSSLESPHPRSHPPGTL